MERRRRLLRRPPGRDGTNTREDKQQTFNIKILLAARRGIDRPLDQNNVVSIHFLEQHFYPSVAARHPD